MASLISPVSVTGSTFSKNRASFEGTLYAIYGNLTVKSSNFNQNSAYHGAGIYADNLTYFEVNGGTFSNNAANGTAGAGESVVIKIDGKKVKTLTTDKDGYVTYKTSKALAVKTHKITAEYKGVSVTNKLVVKQVIKAKNTSFKKSKKTKKYTATLKTSKGKAIKGKKVTFKIKGKPTLQKPTRKVLQQSK